MQRTNRTYLGFSYIEVLLTVAMIGILSVVAILSFNTDPTSLATETDRLRTVLRFAQINAMKDIDYWQVTITQDSFSLGHSDTLADASPTSVILPGLSDSSYTFGKASVSGGTGIISFDERGRPYLGANILTSAHTITLSSSSQGVQDRTITVNAITGFVQ